MPRSVIPAVERVVKALLALSESEQATVILTARLVKESRGSVPMTAAPTPRPARVATPPKVAAPVAVPAAVSPMPRRRRRVARAVAPVEAAVSAQTEPVVDDVVGLEPPDAAPEPAE